MLRGAEKVSSSDARRGVLLWCGRIGIVLRLRESFLGMVAAFGVVTSFAEVPFRTGVECSTSGLERMMRDGEERRR